MKVYHNSDFATKGGRRLTRTLVLAIFSTYLMACSNEPRPDTRPAAQQSFISGVKAERDRASSMPFTDPNRPVIIDEGVKRVKSYILDTLKLTFTDWDARVLDNSLTDPNGDQVKLSFGLSIDDFNLEETGRFKSIVLRQSLNEAQSPIREKLESLKIGDHVQISGIFITRDKRIDVDPYNEKQFRLNKNIFANPEFRVELTDIKQDRN